MIKVIDNKDLVRDPNSKAILNTNREKLLEHRRKKAAMEQLLNYRDETDQRLLKVEGDINEIKNLLVQLLDKAK